MPTPDPRSFHKPVPANNNILDLGAHMDKVKATRRLQETAADESMAASRAELPNPFYNHIGFRNRVTADIINLSQQYSIAFHAETPMATQEQISEGLVKGVNSAVAARYMLIGALCGDGIFDAVDMAEAGKAQFRNTFSDIIDLVAQWAEMNNKRAAQSQSEPILEP